MNNSNIIRTRVSAPRLMAATINAGAKKPVAGCRFFPQKTFVFCPPETAFINAGTFLQLLPYMKDSLRTDFPFPARAG
jgi:hypothetical protein